MMEEAFPVFMYHLEVGQNSLTDDAVGVVFRVLGVVRSCTLRITFKTIAAPQLHASTVDVVRPDPIVMGSIFPLLLFVPIKLFMLTAEYQMHHLHFCHVH